MAIKHDITNEEREKVLKAYLKEGKLDTFPSKEKRKFIILEYIVESFDLEKVYTEKEVNEVIKAFYSDFAIIRRYLVDYKFLERSKDGLEYYVNQNR
ncbi:DUF2087 domain-containing protein [Paucisalibacillus sp. EB02]|uniref:DUF2087 domain-containing protein n=1 Tax=Paucisalibacillus sp. EB02 TaxID=1347087 RepID=UPI000693E730|nr:DUF2087 domain-containing protein [Paucisalibacillus sp. EB02]